MENPNDRPKKDLVNVRIAPELRRRISEIGAREGRTTNAQLIHCAELGVHFDAMSQRGGRADLLQSLFSLITEGADAHRLHKLIDDYFAAREPQT